MVVAFFFRGHSFNKIRKFLVEIFRVNETLFEGIAQAMAEKSNKVYTKKITQNVYAIL